MDEFREVCDIGGPKSQLKESVPVNYGLGQQDCQHHGESEKCAACGETAKLREMAPIVARAIEDACYEEADRTKKISTPSSPNASRSSVANTYEGTAMARSR